MTCRSLCQIKLVNCHIAIALGFVLSGCVANMPQYGWTNIQDASKVMSERDGSIHSFSATCRILLDADAGAVEFRGAIVALPTDYLRVRAWKLTRTVFDITLNRDGLFVQTSNIDNESRSPLQNLTRDRLVEAVTLLPGFAKYADWTIDDNSTGIYFVQRRPLAKGRGTLACQMDKRTLTTTRCDFQDASGVIRQTLRLSDYRIIDNAAWPMHILGQEGDSAFEIQFDDVQINPDLNPRVFVPPTHAIKQP